jgi:hypothetical protein
MSAVGNPWGYTMLRGVITGDHPDLKIEVVPFAADRDELQPRTKPLRGVESK